MQKETGTNVLCPSFEMSVMAVNYGLWCSITGIGKLLRSPLRHIAAVYWSTIARFPVCWIKPEPLQFIAGEIAQSDSPYTR
jgi:hypothetical protein